MHSDHYAPTTTLLGLLPRGRGQGALIAAEDRSSVADLVHGCVRWEWRWDRQVDSRHVYLARLIRDLELPLGPVIELLARDEDTRRRAAGVLEPLALGGSAEAEEALRTDVRETGASPTAPDEERDIEERGKAERGNEERGKAERGNEERDLPTLVAALEQHWVDRTWCGPASLARGLARFGPEAAGAVSLLRRFWLATPHSYERPAYLEALAAIGAAGLAEAYVESLWDCEPAARLLAVEHAPDRPDALRRIAELRDDPIEDPAVREAATARLVRHG
ncbi:hypothetical protein ACFRMQ_36370 [Kitasatospora sp. NPDC056783]|uniref:hypothetical protein n=1 Tax=Kitasatospora sp. NPDC056783 TaxID=3345943 RepID=UPI00369AD986